MTELLVLGGVLVLVLLLAGALVVGRRRFAARADAEVARLAARTPATGAGVIEARDLAGLPEPVARWLEGAGVVGRPCTLAARLEQRGELQTRPGGGWMPFRAEQWILTQEPAFFWIARVRGPFGLHLAGRDRCLDGRGSMRIELLSLIPVVNASGPKIDQGALVRFLAEIIWTPSAALSPYLEWQAIDSRSARATLRSGDMEVSGVFRFEDGDVVGFEAERYRDDELETWIVDNEPGAFREFDGVRIPTRSTITWRADRDERQEVAEPWTWLCLEVVTLSRNGPLSTARTPK